MTTTPFTTLAPQRILPPAIATKLVITGLAAITHAHQHDSYNHDQQESGPTTLRTATAPVASNPDWSSKLHFDTRLSEISFPGTHDTMAYSARETNVREGVAGFWRTQTMTLPQQLESGIRALDIRLRHEKKIDSEIDLFPIGGSNELVCYHGRQQPFNVRLGTATNTFKFDDVLKACSDFLAVNEEEIILMKIKREGYAIDLINKPIDATFAETMTKYMNRASVQFAASEGRDLFWDIASSANPGNPIVHEMRGKIVIVQDGDYGEPGTVFGIRREVMHVQNTPYVDRESGNELYRKWEAVRNHLRAARNGKPDTFYLSFFNAATHPDFWEKALKDWKTYTYFGYEDRRVNPWWVASGHKNAATDADRRKGDRAGPDKQPEFPRTNCGENRCDILHEGVNTLATEFFRGERVFTGEPRGRAGIVLIDFPGKGLIEEIIDLNPTLRTDDIVSDKNQPIDFPLPREPGHDFRFSATGSWPAGISIDSPTTGQIVGSTSQIKTHILHYRATENGSEVYRGVVNLKVISPAYPFISSTEPVATRGRSFTYQTELDPDAPYARTYQLINHPGWLSVDSDGVIRGTPPIPGSEPSLTFGVRVGAGFGLAGAIEEYFSTDITLHLRQPRTITGYRGIPLSVATTSTTFSDATFHSVRLPAGLSIDPTTGVISGTPQSIGVTEPLALVYYTRPAVYEEFHIKFDIAQLPDPVITNGLQATATLGSPFSFEIEADHLPTGFTATGLPSGLAVDSTTGQIGGTPTEAGVFEVQVGATNIEGTTTAPLTLAVQEIVTVTNTDDAGPGSLRDAISNLTSGGTVLFDASLSGQTIPLASPISIDRSVEILASSLPAGITISGNGTTPVVRVPASGSPKAIMSGITISAGQGGIGSGINNASDLTLVACTIANNHASGNGGGIYNTGTLTVDKCLFHGNTTPNAGGAINSRGDNASLTVTNSTFIDNAANRGGAINSTVGSATTITHATIIQNSAQLSGGGLRSIDPATTTVQNSIISDNTAPEATEIEGTPTELGVNTVGTNPRLAPLGDYGGPTLTAPPLPDSIAIDTAPAIDGIAADQRGLPRVSGTAPDLGAAEYQGTPDLAQFWTRDFNNDGQTFGIEFASGADPLAPPASSTATMLPSVISDSGVPGIAFGMNPDATPHTIWVVYHSNSLIPGSFAEVFRYNGSDGTSVIHPDFTIIEQAGTLRLIDNTTPPPTSTFYKVSTELAP